MKDYTTKEDRLNPKKDKEPKYSDLKVILDVVMYGLAIVWIIDRVAELYF